MPCSDGGPSLGEIEQSKRNHQAIVRLACDRCRWFEGQGLPVPSWAIEWWTGHKARDEEELKNSTRRQEQAMVRREALSKLTPEEREELGL